MQILCKLSPLTSNLHLSDEFYFFPPLSTEFSATSLDSGHFCLFFSFVPVFRTTFIIGAQIYMYMNDIKIIVLMTKMMWLMLTRRRRMNVDGNSRPFTRPAPPIIDFTKYVADSINTVSRTEAFVLSLCMAWAEMGFGCRLWCAVNRRAPWIIFSVMNLHGIQCALAQPTVTSSAHCLQRVGWGFGAGE